MCIFAISKDINMASLIITMGSPFLSNNGSTENGTVHRGDFLATIKNRLYFCSAFEIQMLNIEY